MPKLSGRPLAFDDLVNQFNAAQNTPGVEEALETKHWTHAAFYPPVILFDDVVQVGTISNLDGIVPTVIEFVIHAPAPQGRMGWFEAVNVNYPRVAVAVERFTEVGLGGSDVARATKVRFNRFAVYQQRGRGIPTGRSWACQHFSNSGT